MAIERPEIQGWFIPRVTPYGGAPEYIKKQWVDVPLPVRYLRPSEGPEVHLGHDINNIFDITVLPDAVSIAGVDAVKSLLIFERGEAAQWWESYIGDRNTYLAFGIEPQDQLLPMDFLRRILPGIEEFDQIQI